MRTFVAPVIRGVAYAAGAAAAARLFALGGKLVLARLGTESFGVFSFATETFQSVVLLATLGIPYGVMRFLAMGKGRNTTSVFLLSGSALVLGSSVVGALLLFVLAPSPELKLLSVFLPAAGALLVFRSALLGLLRYAHAFFLDVAEAAVRAVAYAIALLLGFGLTGAVLGYGIAAIAAGILGLLFLLPHVTGARIGRPHALALVLFSWPVALSQITTGILEAGSLFILLRLWGAGGVGLYSAALTVGMLLFIVPQIVVPVFAPAFARALTHKGEGALLYQTVLRWIIIISSPIFLVLFAFYTPVVRLLFGSEYVASTAVGRILLVASYIYVILPWIPRQILDMAGHTKQTLALTLVRAGVLVTAWILLVPPLAGVGLALGVAASWAAEGVGAVILTRRLLGISYPVRIWKR